MGLYQKKLDSLTAMSSSGSSRVSCLVGFSSISTVSLPLVIVVMN